MTPRAGLVLESARAGGGRLEFIRPGSPGVGGWSSEPTGLEFAHFRVVIRMQIVLGFSKEGLVSLVLLNGSRQKFMSFSGLCSMFFYNDQMSIQRETS